MKERIIATDCNKSRDKQHWVPVSHKSWIAPEKPNPATGPRLLQ